MLKLFAIFIYHNSGLFLHDVPMLCLSVLFPSSGQREQTSVLMTGIRCQFLVLRPGWWCQGWSLERSTSSVCWHRTNWAQAHSAKLWQSPLQVGSSIHAFCSSFQNQHIKLYWNTSGNVWNIIRNLAWTGRNFQWATYFFRFRFIISLRSWLTDCPAARVQMWEDLCW